MAEEKKTDLEKSTDRFRKHIDSVLARMSDEDNKKKGIVSVNRDLVRVSDDELTLDEVTEKHRKFNDDMETRMRERARRSSVPPLKRLSVAPKGK